MAKFFSPSRRGFYCPKIHAGRIPEDAIEISDREWRALLDAQVLGREIMPDASGFPIAVAREVTTS